MIEYTDKEVAYGVIAGSDFGTSVRILARSPTHVLFNSGGCQVWNRKNTGAFTDIQNIFRGRANKALYMEHKAKIEKFLGGGSGDAVVEAWRAGKTVLIDGGGEKLNEPRKLIYAKHCEEIAKVTINRTVDLTGRVPGCKQCERALQPKFTVHLMGDEILPDHPRSFEDCQKMTNYEVVAISDYGSLDSKVGYVKSFDVWDGSSTIDPHFCSNACAAMYGRRAADAFPVLLPNVTVPPIRASHDVERHYEFKSRTVTLSDGSSLKV